MDKHEVDAHADEARSHHATTTNVPDPQGQLHRGLKERHVHFIAIGGTIGTGLFLSIGSALATSGPLSLFLGYSISSVAIWIMMQYLGEMASLLPLPGVIAQLGSRFVDSALGMAIGWTQWYNCGISICSELSAIVVLVDYWLSLNPAIWISIVLVLIILLNVFAVAIYGEAEFIFASIKVLAIIGLLILALVIDLGGAPGEGRLGFRFWIDPGPMKEYIAAGATGRFLGLFNTLANAAFAYGGVEQVAVAAGETANPTRNIPKAVRRVIWRLVLFYVLGSFAAGLIVSSDDKDLLHGTGVAQSPYLIAIRNAGIPVLPSILNAVIITSVASSANANLYSGSRYMYALALQSQAPRFLLKCSTAGVPIYCVAITSLMGTLAYLTISSGGTTVFRWFSTVNTVAFLLTWLCVCFAYTRFRQALIFNNIDRNALPFKAPGQPYIAWAGVAYFSVVLLFNGFAVFTHDNWKLQTFFSAYIGIPVFLGLFLVWKLTKKTKIVAVAEIDLYTGRVYERDTLDESPVRRRDVWKNTVKGMFQR